MTYDLATVLPKLLPQAIEWMELRSAEILSRGKPLTAAGIRIARSVGVLDPERIRVELVESLPLPDDQMLRDVALQTGLIDPDMAGRTFGYGIYACKDQATNRLLAHECRHVFQYEVAGSIAAFLPAYLKEIVENGYFECPLEVDARQYESIGRNEPDPMI
jgi:hypothetical protein